MVQEHFLDRVRGLDTEILPGEPMSGRTTFRIGGPADIFLLPASVEALRAVLAAAAEEQVPVSLMGAGSNLLVRDGGVRGAVISTRRLTGVTAAGAEITAECGIPLPSLALAARDLGLAGLEFAQGIPGSFGGALCMNAGAYGGEIGPLVRWVDACTPDGTPVRLGPEQLGFGYRKSVFSDGTMIALRACLHLIPGSREEITARMEDYAARRKASQPLELPSAGSTFKRPEGYYAGKLISDAGLKGLRVGGAQVSEKHAGFVVNTGGATAADVLALCAKITETVRERFGVTLEREIKVIGEE